MADEKTFIHQISDFRGGESEEEARGIKGAFKYGLNLNIHRDGLNLLSCNQALKKISGSVVVDLPIRIVRVSATKAYAFGNTGKVYKIDSETVTLVYTDPNGEIVDAYYFYGYLVWSTKAKVKKHEETTASWTDINCPEVTPTSGSYYSNDYHKFYSIPSSDRLYVTNDRYIGAMDSAFAFNAHALDLYYGQTAKALTLIKPNLVIGQSDFAKAALSSWDMASASYDPIEGWTAKDIAAIFESDSGAKYIFTASMLYWFKQGMSSKARRLPGVVRHGAIDMHNEMLHFGTTRGVFSWGSDSKNYPEILNHEYTISKYTIPTDTPNCDIGAVCSMGTKLLVGWKVDTDYGIDITDTANKAVAVYEGLVFKKDSHVDKLFNIVELLGKPLPADCYVKVHVRGNQKGSWVLASTQDNADQFETTDETVSVHSAECQGYTYEVRLELYPHANYTPEITDILSHYTTGDMY